MKTLDIRQQKIVISERQETSKMSFMITLLTILERLQATVLGGETQSEQWTLWGEEVKLRVPETKMAGVHRTEYWRGESRTERRSEICKGFPWSIYLSTD